MAHDQKTAEALEASILHWRENAAATHPYQANAQGDECALCREFADSPDGPCTGCPVHEFTTSHCGHSPWEDAFAALNYWRDKPTSKKNKAAWKAAAQAETDFLISLREPAVQS